MTRGITVPSAKLIIGVNDLQTKFPEIAEQAFEWNPSSVTPGSDEKRKWKCGTGHIWEARIGNRTRQGSGCPYCAGQKAVIGVNDLQTKFPEVAAQACGWNPTEICAKSNKIKRWECKLGHIWSAKVCDRTSGNGCPYCGGKKVLLGFNDLQTKFPEIAAEAFGWDPKSVTPGSNLKGEWKCRLGHIYSAKINSRTGGRGCPFCAGQKLLIGFNDLKSRYPEISQEAHGWDPSMVTSGTPQKREWRCPAGHIYNASIRHRTTNGSKCPICSNHKLEKGFNDLRTKFPQIAAEADGWDPSTVFAGTAQIKRWRCKLGHSWDATVNTRSSGNGCPYCGGKKVLLGFNDLQTKFPEIAAEAFGWDPKTVSCGSNKKMNWRCKLGHSWKATVNARSSGTGCPYCAGKRVMPGFNDLQTKFPEIAEQAFEWDPSRVGVGSDAKNKWICDAGHIFIASTSNRVMGRGCPQCAEFGFNPGKDAYFYLMRRSGEQQIGITNALEQRMKQHERHGWMLVEYAGPFSGEQVLQTERILKRWIKKSIGLIEGTTENWSTASLEVQSLAELKERSGIETDLF